MERWNSCWAPWPIVETQPIISESAAVSMLSQNFASELVNGLKRNAEVKMDVLRYELERRSN